MRLIHKMKKKIKLGLKKLRFLKFFANVTLNICK